MAVSLGRVRNPHYYASLIGFAYTTLLLVLSCVFLLRLWFCLLMQFVYTTAVLGGKTTTEDIWLTQKPWVRDLFEVIPPSKSRTPPTYVEFLFMHLCTGLVLPYVLMRLNVRYKIALDLVFTAYGLYVLTTLLFFWGFPSGVGWYGLAVGAGCAEAYALTSRLVAAAELEEIPLPVMQERRE